LGALQGIFGALSHWVEVFADKAWGPWLLVLLVGGGLFLLLYSRFLPFRHLGHGVGILLGRWDNPDDAGDIPHYQALSSALAGTIGMGNIAGVAIAIQTGGPGAVFWMWVSAFVGVATKFFTCTLAVMYRGRDSEGRLQGGPMYVITEGLGRKWRFLAVFFSLCGLIGCLPLFQVNQLVQVCRDIIFRPIGLVGSNPFLFNLIAGVVIAVGVAIVIFGGITRIGAVASRLVPAMIVLYMGATLWIVFANLHSVPGWLALIVTDAFSGRAAAGGVLGTVIMTGVRRAAFSNEAGIGTEVMAHGAAKTEEPVREGLVAMLGPVVDTLIVCTCTALVILAAGAWKSGTAEGVTLTADAFGHAMPLIGPYLLILCVIFFSVSTMFSYAYYGAKCFSFLAGAERKRWYNLFFVVLVVVGAVASMEAAVSAIDGMFALMAIPTMVSTLILAPRVMKAARDYFKRLPAIKRARGCQAS